MSRPDLLGKARRPAPDALEDISIGGFQYQAAFLKAAGHVVIRIATCICQMQGAVYPQGPDPIGQIEIEGVAQHLTELCRSVLVVLPYRSS